MSQTIIKWICMGFACIPYKEIAEVRISRTNKNVLEILNPQGTVLHMAVFLHTFEGQQRRKIR